MTSIWMQADMLMDIRQTLVYYDHAFNENGTYTRWALEHNKTINGTTESIHKGYFYFSVVIWILPPLLISALFIICHIYLDEFNPF